MIGKENQAHLFMHDPEYCKSICVAFSLNSKKGDIAPEDSSSTFAISPFFKYYNQFVRFCYMLNNS